MIGSKAANIVTRGQLSDYNGSKARATTWEGQAQDEVLNMEPAGFSSQPTGGGDAIILALNSSTTRRVAIGTIAGNRIYADPGEAVIYSPDDGGSIIRVKSGGIDITTNGQMTINGKRVAVEGDQTSDGAVIL